MKKAFILLVISLILTGCSIHSFDDKSIDEVINYTIQSNEGSKLKNNSFNGYSYYIPRELYFINKNDYNSILKDTNNNYYYVYTDVVSYYHKVRDNYDVDSNAFYSNKIENGKKFGYFEINEYNDTYYIEAMYNYTKIEAVVKKENLNDSIVNICVVLSSVKYSDKVLETTVGENALSYKEESYNIFKTKKDTSSFLNYVKEYEKMDEKKKDEDKVKIEDKE